MMRQIRIGISGWTYPPWRGVFYPKGLPQNRELEFASRQLNSIEINGTFYSTQRPSSFGWWYEQVPDDFLFSVKANRYITHTRRLRDIEKPLANFFASGILLFRQKLGPILWQFPPSMKWDAKLFYNFFNLLPNSTREAAKLAKNHDAWMDERSFTEADKNRKLRHAIEIRNSSFATPEFYKMAIKYGVAIVVADTAGKWPLLEELTADFLYLRLHGDEELYSSGYTDRALDRWAEKIGRWKRSRDVFVYFDNDVKVHAPFDALALLRRLSHFEPAQPMSRHPKHYARRQRTNRRDLRSAG